MQPAREDLSGISPLISKTFKCAGAELLAEASTVQALARNRDAAFVTDETSGIEPFVIAGIASSQWLPTASRFLSDNLAKELRRARCHGPAQRAWQALQVLNAAYKKTCAYSESLFRNSKVAVCIADTTTQRLTTIQYGHQGAAMLVESAAGHPLSPCCTHTHLVDGATVKITVYKCEPGIPHRVILGSTGLWKYIHTAKAAIHAHLLTGTRPKAPAAGRTACNAILCAALRTVVAHSIASSSPQLRCLYNIAQLDRIAQGSRAEASTAVLVPRGRGDVHPDLTVACLTATFCPHSSKGSSPAALRAPMQLSSLRSLKSRRSTSSIADSETASEISDADHLGTIPTFTGEGYWQAPNKDMALVSWRRSSSARWSGHTASRPSSASPLHRQEGLMRLSKTRPDNCRHTRRRWALATSFARSLVAEAQLRRHMWHEAIRLAEGSCGCGHDKDSDVTQMGRSKETETVLDRVSYKGRSGSSRSITSYKSVLQSVELIPLLTQ